MAKKLSLDSKTAKEFLVQKGERVGLGAATGLTLLILVLGFLGISTSPPAKAKAATWGKAIEQAAQELERKMRSHEPEVTTFKIEFAVDNFAPAKTWGPFTETELSADNKRHNPRIVKCPSGPDNIQMFALRTPALSYQPDARGRTFKIIDLSQQPSLTLDAKRMVLVYAAFPLEEQLTEFVRALQAGDKDKLLAGPDAPRILGLDVYRTEGKDTAENPLGLYLWKDGKTELAKNLDEFFRRMVIDDDNAKRFADVLGANMATPLPRLATIGGLPKYPKVVIKDVTMPEDDDKPQRNIEPGPGPEGKGFQFPGGKNPKMGKGPEGKGPPEGKLKDADVPPELQERLAGNYNVWDPLGGYLVAPTKVKDKSDKRKKGPKGKKNFPPIKENFPPDKEPEKKLEGQPITPTDATRLLIRFIDVDVEPGKTYRYHFRVRMANPNYGSKDVSTLELSKNKELDPGAFTSTEPITIPEESFYYAVDQHELNKAVKKPWASVVGIDPPTEKNAAAQNLGEVIPVQIHRWIRSFQATGEEVPRQLGDWAIAQRLLFHRGELLGRNRVLIEVPEWFETKNSFDLGIISGGKFTSKGVRGATPVDFLVDEAKVPLLVDFQGGKHLNYQVGNKKLADDSVYELLIMGPDGKLTVRNSRIDSNKANGIGAERERHYDHWRQRLADLKKGGGSSVPTFPGGKGPAGN